MSILFTRSLIILFINILPSCLIYEIIFSEYSLCYQSNNLKNSTVCSWLAQKSESTIAVNAFCMHQHFYIKHKVYTYIFARGTKKLKIFKITNKTFLIFEEDILPPHVLSQFFKQTICIPNLHSSGENLYCYLILKWIYLLGI